MTEPNEQELESGPEAECTPPPDEPRPVDSTEEEPAVTAWETEGGH